MPAAGPGRAPPADQQLAKAAPGAGTFLAKSAMANPNPDERVRALAAIDREALARGTALPWVAKAQGLPRHGRRRSQQP